MSQPGFFAFRIRSPRPPERCHGVEPREFWDRNTILAEAFLASDERMRRAQEVLDGALAERSRTLAAFAVTVGDDGAIADLLGLNEREVRLARRTVGRTDARSVAEALLNHTPNAAGEAEEPAPAPEPAVSGSPCAACGGGPGGRTSSARAGRGRCAGSSW